MKVAQGVVLGGVEKQNTPEIQDPSIKNPTNYVGETPTPTTLEKVVKKEIERQIYSEGVISQREVDEIYGLYMFTGVGSIMIVCRNTSTNFPIPYVKVELTYFEDTKKEHVLMRHTDGSGRALVSSLKEGRWLVKVSPNQEHLKSVKLQEGEPDREIVLDIEDSKILEFNYVEV